MNTTLYHKRDRTTQYGRLKRIQTALCTAMQIQQSCILIACEWKMWKIVCVISMQNQLNLMSASVYAHSGVGTWQMYCFVMIRISAFYRLGVSDTVILSFFAINAWRCDYWQFVVRRENTVLSVNLASEIQNVHAGAMENARSALVPCF